MPKRLDIKNILVVGAGPIKIGQACEFDYSGVQACKALREEGYRVVLINSNPATIMTDVSNADATYIEPLDLEHLKKVILKEKIDAILSTAGGQTAINLSMDLHKSGFLDEHDVELIGANPKAIENAEDRISFYNLLRQEGIDCPDGVSFSSLAELSENIESISFPVILRASFALGGEGMAIARNKKDCLETAENIFRLAPESDILVEQSVEGWKEFEMEIIRDKDDNCILVCAIENINPMGVHTGESITVAPALTLTDKEYQKMRDISFQVLRSVGVETGGSNVQFAVHPETGRMLVIEMNPRVSRSSALASKATGFPIAKVAAKLAVGYSLDELENDITKKTSAFEPSIDYVVTKIPQFSFEKFPGVDKTLNTSMKSIGEVMALGRNFEESLQKGVFSLHKKFCGLESQVSHLKDLSCRQSFLRKKLEKPTEMLLFYIADALRCQISVEEITQITRWDKWFVERIKNIVDLEEKVSREGSDILHSPDFLRYLKSRGFTNERLSMLTGLSEKLLRKTLISHGIIPLYKRVDSCAAEFPAQTEYLYSTYLPHCSSVMACESKPSDKKKVFIIGSGPNNIGQGIEFDYCCVKASLAVREIDGYESIMINCNPETISTDHTSSDKLYFSPVTFENVIDIIEQEKKKGTLVGAMIQFGGQTSLNLAEKLYNAGVPLLGTGYQAIHSTEDRYLCRSIVEKLGIHQPKSFSCASKKEFNDIAKKLDFSVIARPSYIIGGKNIEILSNQKDVLESELYNNFDHFSSVTVEEFISDALEIEIDAICDNQNIFVAGITRNFEPAGIHSGDSSCIFPAPELSASVENELINITKKIAQEIGLRGFINIQFALQKDRIYLIEVNPRASRTIPFLEKATGYPLVKMATKVALGGSLNDFNQLKNIFPNGMFFVKTPIFSFNRLPNVDPILGPEMKSTGETMTMGHNLREIFCKLYGKSYNSTIHKTHNVLILHKNEENSALGWLEQYFLQMGKNVLKIDLSDEPTRVNDKIKDYIKVNPFFLFLSTAQNSFFAKEVRQHIFLHKCFSLHTIFELELMRIYLENTECNTTSIVSLQEGHGATLMKYSRTGTAAKIL